MCGPPSGAPPSFGAGAEGVVGRAVGAGAGSASGEEPSQAARTSSTSAFRISKLKHERARRAGEKPCAALDVGRDQLAGLLGDVDPWRAKDPWVCSQTVGNRTF